MADNTNKDHLETGEGDLLSPNSNNEDDQESSVRGSVDL